MLKWLGVILMELSPHDEEALEENTKDLQARIDAREAAREESRRKSQEFMDQQLRIMGHE